MWSENYKINWHSYSDHMGEMLQDMIRNEKFTDVTLVCDDEIQFKAHKVILSTCSEFFQRIICDIPQQESVIYLKGIQHQDMESILEFMYLGKTKFHESRMDEFLEVAKYLDIKELSTGVEIEKEIKVETNIDNKIHGDDNDTFMIDFYNEISMNAQEELAGINQPKKEVESMQTLLPDDLQCFIIKSNPERDIKFKISKRRNTHMVVDNFILKKRKGPFYSGGSMTINWKCIKDSCSYATVTKGGLIMDASRQHNHEAEPDLYIKKQAKAKMRGDIVNDGALSESNEILLDEMKPNKNLLNPNLHLVSDDLKSLIISSNPERDIKFTLSQRRNTQMVVDNFILKKKKGPILKKKKGPLERGHMVVINWRCIKDSCEYTAITMDGKIKDALRQHNHEAEPELYFQREARAKLIESIANDSLIEDRPANAIKDVFFNTADEDLSREIKQNYNAHQQALRRFSRKLLIKGEKPKNSVVI